MDQNTTADSVDNDVYLLTQNTLDDEEIEQDELPPRQIAEDIVDILDKVEINDLASQKLKDILLNTEEENEEEGTEEQENDFDEENDNVVSDNFATKQMGTSATSTNMDAFRSSEQSSQIEMIMEITNMPKAKALKYLHRYKWNMEQAISSFYDESQSGQNNASTSDVLRSRKCTGPSRNQETENRGSIRKSRSDHYDSNKVQNKRSMSSHHRSTYIDNFQGQINSASDSITRFVMITNTNNRIAKSYLNKNKWNFEKALSRYLANNGLDADNGFLGDNRLQKFNRPQKQTDCAQEVRLHIAKEYAEIRGVGECVANVNLRAANWNLDKALEIFYSDEHKGRINRPYQDSNRNNGSYSRRSFNRSDSRHTHTRSSIKAGNSNQRCRQSRSQRRRSINRPSQQFNMHSKQPIQKYSTPNNQLPVYQSGNGISFQNQRNYHSQNIGKDQCVDMKARLRKITHFPDKEVTAWLETCDWDMNKTLVALIPFVSQEVEYTIRSMLDLPHSHAYSTMDNTNRLVQNFMVLSSFSYRKAHDWLKRHYWNMPAALNELSRQSSYHQQNVIAIYLSLLEVSPAKANNYINELRNGNTQGVTNQNVNPRKSMDAEDRQKYRIVRSRSNMRRQNWEQPIEHEMAMLVRQFRNITDCSSNQAQDWLQINRWQLSAAIAKFCEYQNENKLYGSTEDPLKQNLLFENWFPGRGKHCIINDQGTKFSPYDCQHTELSTRNTAGTIPNWFGTSEIKSSQEDNPFYMQQSSHKKHTNRGVYARKGMRQHSAHQHQRMSSNKLHGSHNQELQFPLREFTVTENNTHASSSGCTFCRTVGNVYNGAAPCYCDQMGKASQIIWVDLSAWPQFFAEVYICDLPPFTFIWAFHCKQYYWKEANVSEAFITMKQNGMLRMSNLGESKMATHVAIENNAGALHSRIRRDVPYKVISEGRGLVKLKQDMGSQGRTVVLMNKSIGLESIMTLLMEYLPEHVEL